VYHKELFQRRGTAIVWCCSFHFLSLWSKIDLVAKENAYHPDQKVKAPSYNYVN